MTAPREPLSEERLEYLEGWTSPLVPPHAELTSEELDTLVAGYRRGLAAEALLREVHAHGIIFGGPRDLAGDIAAHLEGK